MPTKASDIDKQGFFGKKEDLVNRLRDLIGRRVNVQFECASCCKRASGGVLVKVGSDFIELAGKIVIVIFVPGVVHPVVKKARTVIIPIDRVCDVEQPH